MRQFFWLSGDGIPAAFDLRRCGWQIPALTGEWPDNPAVPVLAHIANIGGSRWISLMAPAAHARRQQVLLTGAEPGEERARLLQLGFGDVMGAAPDLGELAERAIRIAARAEMMPRRRELAGLVLDLFARDGFAGGRPLGLHPREFALIWRLAESPGRPLFKTELVNQVWHQAHVPETNSIAVHVFRLRRKLAIAGLGDLVQTVPAGGYALKMPESTAPAIAGVATPRIAASEFEHLTVTDGLPLTLEDWSESIETPHASQ